VLPRVFGDRARAGGGATGRRAPGVSIDGRRAGGAALRECQKKTCSPRATDAPLPLAGLLATAFPSSIPLEGRFILILHGYFDESGTHAEANALSVAGYLSTPERWLEFEKDWKVALDDYGLEFFHMADFANGAPPYSDWEPHEKVERFVRLVSIINTHAVLSIGNSFIVPRYRAIISPAARRALGGPYGLAANCCIMAAAEFLRENNPPDARLRYTFESGAEGIGGVLENFQYLSRVPEQ